MLGAHVSVFSGWNEFLKLEQSVLPPDQGTGEIEVEPGTTREFPFHIKLPSHVPRSGEQSILFPGGDRSGPLEAEHGGSARQGVYGICRRWCKVQRGGVKINY